MLNFHGVGNAYAAYVAAPVSHLALKPTEISHDEAATATLLADRKLKSHVSKTFSFDQIAEAHAQIESGRTVGKIIVNV